MIGRSFLASASLICAPLALAAQDLPTPDSDVILTVSGEISVTNDGDVAVFDRDMLAELEARTFETSTIWTDDVQSFTGVPLDVLLEAVGAEGSAVEATAINDYSVEIPAEDWETGDALVAYLANGAPMSVRDKGPLWIVWPFDDNAEYQTETIYSRSIWQLDRIAVVE